MPATPVVCRGSGLCCCHIGLLCGAFFCTGFRIWQICCECSERTQCSRLRHSSRSRSLAKTSVTAASAAKSSAFLTAVSRIRCRGLVSYPGLQTSCRKRLLHQHQRHGSQRCRGLVSYQGLVRLPSIPSPMVVCHIYVAILWSAPLNLCYGHVAGVAWRLLSPYCSFISGCYFWPFVHFSFATAGSPCREH